MAKPCSQVKPPRCAGRDLHAIRADLGASVHPLVSTINPRRRRYGPAVPCRVRIREILPPPAWGRG